MGKEIEEARLLLGMPKELPKKKYPVRLWAAWKESEDCDSKNISAACFKGLCEEVSNWIDNQPNPSEYIMGSINEFSQTEFE